VTSDVRDQETTLKSKTNTAQIYNMKPTEYGQRKVKRQSPISNVIKCLKAKYNLVRFQVLTAASMKTAVFWVVAPCLITLTMEAASTSETSVNFYQTTWRNNPIDSHLRNIIFVENVNRNSQYS
jgi:hypothetical protein